MAGEAKPEQEHGEGDAEFVEVDPSGRYGRYREVLGKGAFKTVWDWISYKAFDEWEGIEVAWNQVKVADLLRNSDDLERLYSEVHLLKTLKHKNIIKFYNSWVDSKEGNINFITEIFTSGTLRQYRKKHKHVDIRALKNWSRQILQGLHYLHSHDPPVIHRDLKCDNIFVNGNQGEVKIGDLGLAAILLHAQSAHSVIGTPEFMAPELYEEDYNELVDIYAFGMCLLELVTFEYPYVECTNAAQIYKKVTAGIKPASLEKVNDPEVRRFIEKCIAKVSERLPARDLLTDPFLQSDIEDESIGHSSEHGVNHSDDNCRQFGEASSHLNVNADSSIGTRDFTVQGEMKDMNTIFLKLRITDSIGHAHNIYFPFDIEADTSISVSSEMVAELDLTDHDVTVIAAMIDAEIQSHVNGWIPDQPVNESHSNDETALDNFDSGKKDEVSALPPGSDLIRGGLVLERFPSGRKYWCDSPKGVNEESVRHSLSKISRVTHHGNAQNVLEVNDGETSTLNPDEKVDHSNGISSPSQLNASTFSVDCGRHSSCIADQSISFKLHGTSIRSTVNGEDGEDAPHQTNGCASLINLTSNLHIADVSECSGPPSSNANDEAPFCTDHQFADGQVRPVVDQHGDHDNTDLPHDDKTSVETDPDDVKTLLGKLKTLLLEQQKELQELKEKHNLAIKDVLKKLPPDIQDMTLDTYGLNTPLFKIHGEASKSSGHSKNVDFICEEAALPSHVGSFLIHDITEESSSTTNMEEIATSDVGMSCLEGSTSNVGKDERKEHMPGNHLGGLIFRDRSHLWKVDSKSYDVGIAVILIDDLSNTKYEADVPSTKSDEG